MKVLLCHQAPSSDPSASSDSTSQTIQAYPLYPLVLSRFISSPPFTSPKHSKLPDIALFNKVKFKKRVAFRGEGIDTKNTPIFEKVVSSPPRIVPPQNLLL